LTFLNISPIHSHLLRSLTSGNLLSPLRGTPLGDRVARITLGLGTSHGPMLSVRPEIWPERVKADRANPQHFYKGKTYTFDELFALRKAENLAEQITPEVFRERRDRCQQAIRKLGDVFEAHKADVAVVVGNDQMEVFTKEHLPAFAVFWGDFVEGIPRTPEFLATLPPGGRTRPDSIPVHAISDTARTRPSHHRACDSR